MASNNNDDREKKIHRVGKKANKNKQRKAEHNQLHRFVKGDIDLDALEERIYDK